jgi:hypothetical protein
LNAGVEHDTLQSGSIVQLILQRIPLTVNIWVSIGDVCNELWYGIELGDVKRYSLALLMAKRLYELFKVLFAAPNRDHKRAIFD